MIYCGWGATQKRKRLKPQKEKVMHCPIRQHIDWQSRHGQALLQQCQPRPKTVPTHHSINTVIIVFVSFLYLLQSRIPNPEDLDGDLSFSEYLHDGVYVERKFM
ncbi:hypothetical protein PROFUN_10789 [Planoprotostelium fungivorum]|uniref:Uncharacterized protein n=1 Tax=Planoprotostelium fungivorum TaxID=1890364 RepID=A0A2P6NCY4_9EUKA|nr:hypothetical protein PROFUN_10789 [Planoprotostelium fungivorum]